MTNINFARWDYWLLSHLRICCDVVGAYLRSEYNLHTNCTFINNCQMPFKKRYFICNFQAGLSQPFWSHMLHQKHGHTPPGRLWWTCYRYYVKLPKTCIKRGKNQKYKQERIKHSSPVIQIDTPTTWMWCSQRYREGCSLDNQLGLIL